MNELTKLINQKVEIIHTLEDMLHLDEMNLVWKLLETQADINILRAKGFIKEEIEVIE